MKPTFLGIGAQKCGTTTLYKMLSKEENIYLTKKKEVHYFSLHYEKGRNWYENHFKEKGINQIAGEITPFYIFHDECARRIYEYNNMMKLIILLRNPIDRAISHYYHARKRGYENLEIQDAFDAEESRLKKKDIYSYQKHSYISRSKYMEQINKYKMYFPESQMLIIKSEDLFENPNHKYGEIIDFLEINGNKTINDIEFENKGGYNKMTLPRETKNWLETEFKKTFDDVKKIYGITW